MNGWAKIAWWKLPRRTFWSNRPLIRKLVWTRILNQGVLLKQNQRVQLVCLFVHSWDVFKGFWFFLYQFGCYIFVDFAEAKVDKEETKTTSKTGLEIFYISTSHLSYPFYNDSFGLNCNQFWLLIIFVSSSFFSKYQHDYVVGLLTGSDLIN